MNEPKRYHHTTDVHNVKDASEVVPVLIKMFSPGSVADVGCGLATWLKVFQDEGVKNITGFDGEYVDTSKLYIATSCFKKVDLEKPLVLSERFDMALCLEVAEHLSIESAPVLVKSLTAASDVIIFSAAVPGQGGQNHINEQWPQWWSALFEKQGYHFYDVFREQFWNNENIAWWYRQNIFLVTKPEIANRLHLEISDRALIHPQLFTNKINRIKSYENGAVSVASALSVLKKSLIRVFTKK